MSHASEPSRPSDDAHRLRTNRPARVAAASAIKRKLVSLPMVLTLCLTFSVYARAADANSATARAQTSTYVFIPDQSSIVQTGGIAGVHRTYTVEGSFQLSIDPNVAEAAFPRVDATATYDSDPWQMLDPNEVFNLTALTGRSTVDEIYAFDGRAADSSSVQVTLALKTDGLYLTGQTMPPPGSADFFLFSIEAVARLKYGGGTGEPNDPYQIWTPEQMNAIGANPDWDKDFKLMADIDLSCYSGQEFNRIGYQIVGARTLVPYPFSGVFDGNGHTISNFSYRALWGVGVGLFGYVDGAHAAIMNLGLIDPNVSAELRSEVASLVGGLGQGTVANCYATGGTVTGYDVVGGLVGFNQGTISNCAVLGTTISGRSDVGGLLGHNSDAWLWYTQEGTVTECRARSSVTGQDQIGGLVGFNLSRISACQAAGDVMGEETVGGLVGQNGLSRFRGVDEWIEGQIDHSYSTCAVAGNVATGGLVGFNDVGIIEECYSIGPVTGDEETGGLVGRNAHAEAVDCFWDTETSGLATSAGGTGKTTAEMQTAAMFLAAGWDFVGETDNGTDDIWWIDEGRDYPRLWWELEEQ